jgi:hypothetical protein
MQFQHCMHSEQNTTRKISQQLFFYRTLNYQILTSINNETHLNCSTNYTGLNIRWFFLYQNNFKLLVLLYEIVPYSINVYIYLTIASHTLRTYS